MLKRPLILISPDIDAKGKEFGDLSSSLSGCYEQALLDAGALPLTLPATISRDALAECVRRTDGVLLTGGDDVDPRLYTKRLPGQVRRTVGITPDGGARDFRELLLLIRDQLTPRQRLCWATKGFEISTGRLPAEVAREVLGTNRLTAVQIASGVARVSAGSAHTIFTKIDGTVWGMGAADGGVLLNPALTSSQTTPVQLPGGMAKVVAGSGLTMFIGADGVLWAVGNNNSGQLGDGQISVGMIPLSTSGIVSATIGQQLSNLFPTMPAPALQARLLTQRGNDLLPRTLGGAHRLDQRPILVALPVEGPTISAQEHAQEITAARQARSIPRSPLQRVLTRRDLKSPTNQLRLP